MKKILLIGSLTVSIFAANSLDEKNKFYINSGFEYDGIYQMPNEKTIFTSVSLKRSNYKIGFYYSKQSINSSDEYKRDDTTLSFYNYSHPFFNAFTAELGAEVYFPTYYNKKTDYAFSAKGTVSLKNYSVSFKEKHKIYGESSSLRKDEITFSVGTNRDNLHIEPYVYTEDIPSNHSKWYKYAGLVLDYRIFKHLDVSLNSSVDVNEHSNYSVIGAIGVSF